MYKINMLTVAEPRYILDNYVKHIARHDTLGDYIDPLMYLPYEYAKHFIKSDVEPKSWKPLDVEDLRNDLIKYLEWWKRKIEIHSAFGVYKGKDKVALLLLIAGIPEWHDIWYSVGEVKDIYNKVADLFKKERLS